MAEKKRLAVRVRNPWGDYEVNQLITDADEVKAILSGPHELDVLKVAAEPEEAPKPREAARDAEKPEAKPGNRPVR
jgi:hypothetical protein